MASWNPAKGTKRNLGEDWEDSRRSKVENAAPWEVCNQLHDAIAEYNGVFAILHKDRLVPWEQATATRSNARDIFKALDRTPRWVQVPWQRARQKPEQLTERFVQLRPSQRFSVMPWTEALNYYVARRLGAQEAARLFTTKGIPWEEAKHPKTGREPTKPVDPKVPYLPNTNLIFECKWVLVDPLGVMLNFGKHPCPGSPVIPDRKVYFIVNTLSMKRMSDNTPIELVSASVGIDKNSWCWSFSGAVPYTEFEKVEPTATGPVEVELEINGLVWRLLIEKYNTKEVFAKTDISISGRSITAWLDEPYAPVRSFAQTTALTSRQFAEAELTRAGLVTGFTLDWQLVDALGWQMPANTWSYTDLTPVQVIQAIAQGAGGYVNSHPSAKELIVRAAYPMPFWEWAVATVDHTIPESLILSRSLDWEERPVYNGVYVSGELTGVNDFVRRAGTNGAMQAPPFVGPMISDHAAARSKGIAILSASGKQARVGLELPMEPTLGLVTPGMLLQVQKDASNNWRGLVNSTQIGAAWGDNDSLTVSQSIELERHYGGL